MTFTIWDLDNGCLLNLSKPDLGQPHLLGRWEQLRAGQGTAVCPDFDVHLALHGHRHEPMILVVNQFGTRLARHRAEGREHPALAGESDEYKAMKERTARRAERAGFTVEVEANSADRSRRTDVLIHGSGVLLGCEPQFSDISQHGSRSKNFKDGLKARSARAVRDGITPMWITNRSNDLVFAPVAPWARVERMPWHRIADQREPIPIRSGLRGLVFERCGTRVARCPLTVGKPCGQSHPAWNPVELPYDDVIVRAASGDLVPLYVTNNKSFYWVRADARDQYLDSGFSQGWEARLARQRETRPKHRAFVYADDPVCRRYGRDLLPESIEVGGPVDVIPMRKPTTDSDLLPRSGRTLVWGCAGHYEIHGPGVLATGVCVACGRITTRRGVRNLPLHEGADPGPRAVSR